ncbi:hypothetical protein PHAVU_002G185000 [Phaseolus vulgaris]|uniref:Uncharacterized protein n=1 Tax=Phaseolus vulgaris TaxID=3885 RepID=V7CNJ7_PHAVU|nr:hypothetical protein PHAVU_002G185000g [Phaseolus vulgaris]ESW30815.1 hypothetical protein PHAVU_002G185000g [Phaseolus vulgaris]
MVIYPDSLMTHSNDEFSLVVNDADQTNQPQFEFKFCVLSFIMVSSFKLLFWINLEKHYFMLCNLSTKDHANKIPSSLVLQLQTSLLTLNTFTFSSTQLSDISSIPEFPIQPCLA